MTVETRLAELGIVLVASSPSNSYVSVKTIQGLAFVAGHSPKKDGKYPYLGKVGDTVTLEQAQESARQCVVNCLASLKQALGSLDRVQEIVKVVGYVASAPNFIEQPKVINAASDLLLEIFGDAGKHARTSVGVAVLPGDIPVEIEMIVGV